MSAAGVLRLFVAVYPPASAVAQLLEVCSGLELPRHRLTPQEQVHLTLHFIGETPAAELPEVEESVRRSVAGLDAFEMRVTRLITLPERGPARLIAAEADEHPTLSEIHRRLVHRLAMRPRGRERFLPHFTLLRFAAGAGFQGEARVAREIEPLVFQVGEVVLVRSVLKASGVEHAAVLRAPLE